MASRLLPIKVRVLRSSTCRLPKPCIKILGYSTELNLIDHTTGTVITNEAGCCRIYAVLVRTLSVQESFQSVRSLRHIPCRSPDQDGAERCRGSRLLRLL
eukprot:scaffold71573_cov35-Prasinocladus_malaysianus.AAC.1